MITIVDYGMGNLQSIQSKLKKIRFDSIISSNPQEIRNAKKIILPGVGHFGSGMSNLKKLGLKEALDEAVLEKRVPVFGICLGMQLMGKGSEEGSSEGLGWLSAQAFRFKFPENDLYHRVPHVGWNELTRTSKKTSLYDNVPLNKLFYFTHSFYMQCEDENLSLTTTEYGSPFTSSFQKENIIGVQFHPEKSRSYGLRLIENFIRMTEC